MLSLLSLSTNVLIFPLYIGIDYGSGIFVVDGEPDDKAFETWEEEHATGKLNDIEWYPEEEDWRLIGHDGHGNSFMYAWPKAQVC